MERVHEPALIANQLEEWSSWLEQHHALSTHLWLKIRRVHCEGSGIYLAEAVNEALRWGWIDGLMSTEDRNGFWLRFSPRKPHSVWSLTNYQRVQAHLAANRMMPMGLKTIEWAHQYGSWDAYEQPTPSSEKHP